MKRRIMAYMALSMLFFADVIWAVSPQPPVKIGEITASNGEVLIRAQGKWMRLKKTPRALYGSDKVVTRRGRAEIVFVDGGHLRLDVDTNVSIHQRLEKSTSDAAMIITSQQVNILVGDVWFDVKIKPTKRSLKFRTPTMTAAIRGTQGGFSVDVDGASQHGVSEGETFTQGQFSPLSDVSQPDLQGALPPSNPDVDSSPIQQAAAAAVKASEQADLTVLAFDRETDDAQAETQALVSAVQAAYNHASANHATLQEMMLEAQLFGLDTETLNSQIQDSRAALAQLDGLLAQAKAIASDITATASEESQQAGLATLEEIKDQANNIAGLTDSLVNESSSDDVMPVFQSTPFSEDETEDVQTPPGEETPPSTFDDIPTETQNKEILIEGDIDNRIDPSPAQ